MNDLNKMDLVLKRLKISPSNQNTKDMLYETKRKLKGINSGVSGDINLQSTETKQRVVKVKNQSVNSYFKADKMAPGSTKSAMERGFVKAAMAAGYKGSEVIKLLKKANPLLDKLREGLGRMTNPSVYDNIAKMQLGSQLGPDMMTAGAEGGGLGAGIGGLGGAALGGGLGYLTGKHDLSTGHSTKGRNAFAGALAGAIPGAMLGGGVGAGMGSGSALDQNMAPIMQALAPYIGGHQQ